MEQLTIRLSRTRETKDPETITVTIERGEP